MVANKPWRGGVQQGMNRILILHAYQLVLVVVKWRDNWLAVALLFSYCWGGGLVRVIAVHLCCIWSIWYYVARPTRSTRVLTCYYFFVGERVTADGRWLKRTSTWLGRLSADVAAGMITCDEDDSQTIRERRNNAIISIASRRLVLCPPGTLQEALVRTHDRIIKWQ